MIGFAMHFATESTQLVSDPKNPKHLAPEVLARSVLGSFQRDGGESSAIRNDRQSVVVNSNVRHAVWGVRIVLRRETPVDGPFSTKVVWKTTSVEPVNWTNVEPESCFLRRTNARPMVASSGRETALTNFGPKNGCSMSDRGPVLH